MGGTRIDPECLRALAEHHHASEIARRMGMPRGTIWAALRRHGIVARKCSDHAAMIAEAQTTTQAELARKYQLTPQRVSQVLAEAGVVALPSDSTVPAMVAGRRRKRDERSEEARQRWGTGEFRSFAELGRAMELAPTTISKYLNPQEL